MNGGAHPILFLSIYALITLIKTHIIWNISTIVTCTLSFDTEYIITTNHQFVLIVLQDFTSLEVRSIPRWTWWNNPQPPKFRVTRVVGFSQTCKTILEIEPASVYRILQGFTMFLDRIYIYIYIHVWFVYVLPNFWVVVPLLRSSYRYLMYLIGMRISTNL